MKHLVLGSSGQIGSALCEYYKNKGHTVDEFDIVNGVKVYQTFLLIFI